MLLVLRALALTDLQSFEQVDGPTLRATIRQLGSTMGWNKDVSRLRCIFTAARAHPIVDPSGRFKSHLDVIPREFMENHPSLWHCPSRVCQNLMRLINVKDFEIAKVWVDTLVRDAQMGCNERRNPDRAVRCSLMTFTQMLHWMQRLALPLSELLSLAKTRAEVIDLVARLVGFEHVHRRDRVRKLPGQVDNFRERCVMFFNGCIRRGMYANQVPPEATIRLRELTARLFELEHEAPHLYALECGPVRQKPPNTLDEESIQRLFAACDTERSRLILRILHEMCLRCHAIEIAEVDAVWDTSKRQPRKVWTFLEKNSDVRRLAASTELCNSLEVYMKTEHPGDTRYLFPHRRCPSKWAHSTVPNCLTRLCERAGTAHFYPHQFRHHFVNTAMSKGNRIENVSRYLGHRSVNVTYQRYWTDEAPMLELNERKHNNAPPPSSTGTITRELCAELQERTEQATFLATRLSEAQEEIERLRVALQHAGVPALDGSNMAEGSRSAPAPASDENDQDLPWWGALEG